MGKFSIYLRRDGRWEGRLQLGRTEDGKRKYRAFFGKTKEEVQAKIAENVVEIPTEPTACTLAELFSEWHQKIAHTVKESTAANYLMKATKHILPCFGNKSIDDITSEDVYNFIEQKKEAGLSGRYVSDIIILMKTLFKYAVRRFRIVNPMEEVTLKKVKSAEVSLLSANEKAHLEKYIWQRQDRTSMGIAVSLATGIRIGELCALRWEDVDLEKRILTVRHTLQRIQIQHDIRRTKLVITDPKSESSRRSIPIPEFLIPLLRKFRGKSEEFVLSGKTKPTEPRTMQYRFAKILKKADLPSVHFHALRHMFATSCIKLGFDVKTLSEILGHSSVEITLNRYVHSSFEQKVAYMNRLKPAV
ncbi:MAG: site-specific integrase [Ruminococcus flavefaciens]|nr:site-specific integrase [Ruminococcus flavefaciens]MCM1363324.1 site-specific integrase [Clostridiales bacterium]